MGLIKSGIKYGALAYVASQASKAFASHEEKKQEPRSSSPETRAPRGLWEPPVYEDNGYVHQRWCSGECGHQCRGSGKV